nr:hypothetical protein [Tanacetum cinerariifolium]
MKRVRFDDKVNKHQTLVQDFIQLQKDTEVARNNLMALKQKKLTLEAEVRFLRQRHKFLINNKSSTPQEHGFAKPQPTQLTTTTTYPIPPERGMGQPTQLRKSKKEHVHFEKFAKPQPTQLRKSKKEHVHFEKQATVRNLPPIDKKKAPRRIPSPEFDMLIGKSVHDVKQQSVQRVIANQRVRVNGPKASALLDLSKRVDFLGSQNHMGQTQKPVIDLNMISREEEVLQQRSEPFNPSTHSLIRNDVEMLHTDVRFDPLRNITGGSSLGGRAGKRKISWQDPVAF